MTPVELLAAAREYVAGSDETASAWPKAAALLGRQALEQELEALGEARFAGFGSANKRSQLLSLELLLAGDQPLAKEVTWAYSSLSRACHHHPYQLPPTALELKRWLDVVERLMQLQS